MSYAIDVIVRRGIDAAQRVQASTLRTESGVQRSKTIRQNQQEHAVLEEIAQTLDELGWHGPWGTTAAAVRIELLRRARERD